MAPVCNVRHFLSLLFTDVELRQMPHDIFVEALDDKPTTGHFTRLETPTQGSLPWTAYGIHLVVGIILASFIGEDTPETPECTLVMASKITEELLQHAPSTVLHPSGTHLCLRGFTGKSVHACTLDVTPRTDRVQAAFFHRHRNDTSLMNATPSMSMLASPMQPYMFEDLVHTRWGSFLTKSHQSLVYQWDSSCALHGVEVEKRGVKPNSSLGTLMISDMYRSLDPAKIPCNDTLLYGVYYPIVGAGLEHISGKKLGLPRPHHPKWTSARGWVYLRDAKHSEIHIFKQDPVYSNEVHNEVQEASDAEGDVDIPTAEYLDMGHVGRHEVLATKDVFSSLRCMSMLVQPLVNRPGAILYDKTIFSYGMLEFDLSTGRCYKHSDGTYTMRIPHSAGAGAEPSVDQVTSNKVKVTPLELEEMMLGVPTVVMVDTQAFVFNGVPERFLPTGADTETYLKCNLWYPNHRDMYVEDHVYLLAHTGGLNSSSFSLIHCNFSWLVHPDNANTRWDTITNIRSCD